jgi:hypothetical protein
MKALIICPIFAAVFTAMRLYTRIVLMRKYFWEDASIGAALVGNPSTLATSAVAEWAKRMLTWAGLHRAHVHLQRVGYAISTCLLPGSPAESPHMRDCRKTAADSKCSAVVYGSGRHFETVDADEYVEFMKVCTKCLETHPPLPHVSSHYP